MSDVIPHDFGKQHRDAARSYARLVGVIEARAEAFIGNPTEFFADAGDRITKLRLVIEEAERALWPGPVGVVADDASVLQPLETVVVPKDEYERLRRCAAIVRAAVR